MKRNKKIIFMVCSCLFFSLAAATLFPAVTAVSETVKQGSSGATVKQVQQKLKDLGYYSGSVDGIFGTNTKNAVMKFQKAKGLTADGVAGSATLSALGIGSSSANATLRQGDQGNKVKEVQQKLKNWGYYSGNADGIFGQGTKDAVIKFQKNNNLPADGIVGTKTFAALGISPGSADKKTNTAGVSNKDDSDLLARVIHAEAEGEPYIGKVAVAAVLLNRIESPQFPNTLSGVIYQKNAISSVYNGRMNNNPGSDSVKAANDALNGWDPTYGCLYFWNPDTSTSAWIQRLTPIMRFGKHVFSK